MKYSIPVTFLSPEHNPKTGDTMTSIESILNFFSSPVGIVTTFSVLIVVNYIIFKRLQKRDE
jgi:hypothetical protein